MATNAINPDDKVEIDFSKYDIAAEKLQPTLYKDGDIFCCLSGPDPETGIFGCGDTPDNAIREWRSALDARLKKIQGDEA